MADVAVVGAGVIGCSVARRLAPEQDVVVVDKGQVAGEATALAAGLVTMTPSYTDEPSISEYANGFFEEYAGTGDVTYPTRESLELVAPDDEAMARRRVERERAAGHPIDFIDHEALTERFPRIDASNFAGAVTYGPAGWVDPYTFAVTLQREAVERGARFVTDTAVTAVLVENGAVTGIETAAGPIEAETVVAAAGWRTRELLVDHVPLPVRPYRTQCIVLEPERSMRDVPIGWLPDEHVYFRPELNGDLLVGGWSFAEDHPETASDSEDEAFRLHVADLLPEIFRDADDMGVVNGWAGIDAATPDTRPIIDTPADAPEGLVVATGFNGRGIMTAPVAAAVVDQLVTDTAAPFPVEPFVVDRFDSRSTDFEFVSVSA